MHGNIYILSLHHSLSGALLLPVLIYGWTGCSGTGRTMFLLGTLCDIGWESYDIFLKTFQAFFAKPAGCTSQCGPLPVAMWVIACIFHHPMALAFVIPMNIYFPDQRFYAILAFDLLLAAGIMLITGNLKMYLDVDKKNSLCLFKFVVIFQLVVIVVTRFIVFFPCLWIGLKFFHHQGKRVFFVGGIIVSVGMSLLNLVFLSDCIAQCKKWLPYKPKPSTQGLLDATVQGSWIFHGMARLIDALHHGMFMVWHDCLMPCIRVASKRRTRDDELLSHYVDL
eukprot:SAG31_NODE_2239_length_6115_cov_2.178191_3_plen_280_part_00